MRTEKTVFFLNTRKLSPPSTEHRSWPFGISLPYMTSFLSPFTFIRGVFFGEGGSILSSHTLAHLRDEVCFRIKFLNLIIIYPARASGNTPSMAKYLIDKYWNRVIWSCLSFLLTFYILEEKKTENETCRRSRKWLFLPAYKCHDIHILIWIIKCIFAWIIQAVQSRSWQVWTGNYPACALFCLFVRNSLFVPELFRAWHFKIVRDWWKGGGVSHLLKLCFLCSLSSFHAEIGLKGYF